MEQLSEVLICFFVCVLMPIGIVFLVYYFKSRALKMKTQVLMQAIEKGKDVDLSALEDPKRNRSLTMSLQRRLHSAVVLFFLGICFVILSLLPENMFGDSEIMLTPGVILLGLGLAQLLSWFISRRMLAKEIEMERKKALGEA